MSLHDVLNRLVSHPEVQGAISLPSFALFFDLVHHFKDTLAWTIDPAHSGAPNLLSSNILSFFSAALGVPSHITEELWSLLRQQAWEYTPSSNQISTAVLEVIMKFGPQHGIGEYKFGTWSNINIFVTNLLYRLFPPISSLPHLLKP